MMIMITITASSYDALDSASVDEEDDSDSVEGNDYDVDSVDDDAASESGDDGHVESMTGKNDDKSVDAYKVMLMTVQKAVMII